MKVLILGASGQIGRRLVAEMLYRGNEVTAFIHGPDHLTKHHNLRVVQGDVHSKDDLENALKGQQLVMSALGSWGTPTHNILSSAMANIVPLMQKHSIKRIISLTGADARDLGDNPGFLSAISHRILQFVARKVLQDGELHIKLLRNSDLDWTVVRSPVMTNRRHSRYKLAHHLPKPWQTVPRHCVVMAMADLAESRRYVKRSPVILPA